MDPERYRRAGEIFHAALSRPATERAEFVRSACGGDAALQAEVERLLGNDARAEDLLERFDLFEQGRQDPLVGQPLGAWRIVERIAAGGMGVVYRARRADGLFEQDVAVKLLRTETASPDMLARFDAERRILARLEHPNVARLLDGGRLPSGTPFLVMEFIDGLPIDRFCNQHGLDLERRLGLFSTVCRAVQFAHGNLVLHRDLKPSNVLVDVHGTVKLLDFGIALLLDTGDGAHRTVARALTPEYASPEQQKGLPLTTASDVYSLGVVLYQLLTGRKPLEPASSSAADWERTVAEETPTRPSTALLRPPPARGHPTPAAEIAAGMRTTVPRLCRRLRGDLDRIVLMALRKEPERRYASAEQLAEDIERFLGGQTVRARPDTVLYRLRRFVRRNRLAVAAAAAVLLALCGALWATWHGQWRAERSAEFARAEQGRAESARRQAEAAAAHARIEAGSFRLIAEFLSDTFLDESEPAGGRGRLTARVRQQAERIRRQYGDQPHLRANLLDALGRMCARVDAVDQADELLHEARDIRLAAFGPESLEIALSLSSLGFLHYRRGEFAAAAEALERALDLHRRLPADVHTDPATAANDLASALRHLGRLDEARALHEEALARRRADLGDEALPVAESRNNLACVLMDERDFAAAAEQAATALAIRRRILGADHQLTLQAAITLAGAEWNLGRTDRAQELLQDAVAEFRALGGVGVEGLTHTIGNLATLHIQAGDFERALPLAREALELVRQRVGPDHPQVATAMDRLALLIARGDQPADAAPLWQEVLRIRRAHYPSDHPILARTLLSQANLLVQTGAAAPAEPPLREALTIAASRADFDPVLHAHVETSLGTCLGRLGRTEEALNLLASAERRFLAAEGPASKNAASVAKRRRDLQD